MEGTCSLMIMVITVLQTLGLHITQDPSNVGQKFSNSHLDHDESVLAEGRALHGERGGSACIGSCEVELVRHHDSAIINTNRKENGG